MIPSADSDLLPVRNLHIPKTAGTTLSSGLLRHFGRRHAFHFSTDPDADRQKLLAMSEAERKRIPTFIGHSLFETGVDVADRATLVTFLREPVARAKSFVAYVAAGKTAHRPEGGGPETFSVAEFLESGVPELSNLQVKALINRDRLHSELLLRELGEDQALDLAVKHLFERVRAFGLQERFDESWVEIWSALAVRPPLFAEMNRGRNKNQIEFRDDEIEVIKRLNQLDLELYRRAASEFEARIRERADHRVLLDEFRKRQSRYGKVYSRIWNRGRRSYRQSLRWITRLRGNSK